LSCRAKLSIDIRKELGDRSETLGKIIQIHSKPKPLYLGDRKENFNKRFESIERKKVAIEEMKKNIKKGK
jgi:hypothetical protein